MGCTSGCLKLFLNILNSINMLVGFLLIAVATISLGQAPPFFILYFYIIGAFAFVTSIIGCCGICRESVCLTTAYAVMLLVYFVVQLMWVFGFKFDENTIKNYAANDVEKIWNEELVHPGAMNATQLLFDCCGRNGPGDYSAINRDTLPSSCYPNNEIGDLPPFTKGCVQAVSESYLSTFKYSSSSEWLEIIFSAIMCLAAFYLVRRFRKDRRRYHY
ncbi:23 kDa integral membrane protein [Scaptodrosophila lebanonensis]|uniref:23 kDa integral membrane protein n=1 Tax=Drosophila lebanonensis TaxID=7225 RepID=A0A6J2UGS3_DROLE|nr:23 kDa integral membrane protein [Scaptodrosophila lebanonensis]